jgi:hypothetical protein
VSSAVATPGQPGSSIVALWRRHDGRRAEQLARLSGLELQGGYDYGLRVWEQAKLLWQNLPEGVRVDLPSARAFGAVLGLFRTCVTLKKDKIAQLELSVEEIARLVGYSKATVEAVLRWLGCESIEYAGAQVSRGLNILHRGRRTGPALVPQTIGGKIVRTLRMVYRTSRIVLTLVGRALLGLGPLERKVMVQPRSAPKTDAPTPMETPPPICESPPGEDVGRSWLAAIKNQLK